MFILGFQLDAQAALEYLFSRKDIDTQKIVLFGRSLGGAVALDLGTLPAYTDRLFAVIVENTFTSIPAMAGQLLGGLHRLPYFCFKNKVSSWQLYNYSLLFFGCSLIEESFSQDEIK